MGSRRSQPGPPSLRFHSSTPRSRSAWGRVPPDVDPIPCSLIIRLRESLLRVQPLAEEPAEPRHEEVGQHRDQKRRIEQRREKERPGAKVWVEQKPGGEADQEHLPPRRGDDLRHRTRLSTPPRRTDSAVRDRLTYCLLVSTTQKRLPSGSSSTLKSSHGP